MLAPPYPNTPADERIWIPQTVVSFPPPILQKWIPPVWIPPSPDGGFWLAQQVICYQRGYYPEELFHQYMETVAKCFGVDAQEATNDIQRLAYDFFIVIVSHDRRPIAGCVVEFRPPVSKTDTPYLYVSTVCTNPSYGSKGLAHQLIHSVYTLGTILIEQNATAPGIWRNAIPNRYLYMGLTIARTPGSDVADRLKQLYSQCGLSTHHPKKRITYESFTPYSIYNWQIENQYRKSPMWQSIAPGVLYEDTEVRILSPALGEEEGVSMYHTFPAQRLYEVQSAGIVHPKHTFLHKDPSKVYVPDKILFQNRPPMTGGLFRIQAQSKLEAFELRISVPVWFAAETDTVGCTVH